MAVRPMKKMEMFKKLPYGRFGLCKMPSLAGNKEKKWQIRRPLFALAPRTRQSLSRLAATLFLP
jgi:hypothetical protein